MGSCEEYTSEYISTKAFKLIGIGSITQPFGYYIIKDYYRPAVEKAESNSMTFTLRTSFSALRFS